MYKYVALFGLVLVATAQEQPTFQTGTRLVQVDVIVRNKSGPVEGLKKEDFTLFDEGKPQQISVFTATSGRKSLEREAPLPEGTVSNRVNRQGEAIASATVLLIDRLNTPVSDQVYANAKVMKFLREHGGSDRIGIYMLGSGLRVVQELTDDPARLSRAANGVKAQAARGLSSDVTVDSTGDAVTDQMVADSLERLENFVARNRVETTRDALIAIARHLARVPGRKNLIWVSGSFPLIIVNAHDTVDFSKEVGAATRALNDANVAVYAVDARGLMPSGFGNAERQGLQVAGGGRGAGPIPPVGPSGVDTMHMLTGMTGGRAFYNSNGIDDSIQRAMEDAELTYMLGFYPSEDAFDEKFHKLAVKVDRKDVEVRFRQGYFASKVRPGSEQSPTALTQLLRDPLDSTAVGITVAVLPDASQTSSYKVKVTVDLRDVHLERQGDRWQGTLLVSFLVEGSKTAWNMTRKIDIPDAQLAAALKEGIEVNSSVQAETGSLRVVAQDQSTGAAGSIRVALVKR